MVQEVSLFYQWNSLGGQFFGEDPLGKGVRGS